MTKRLRVFAGPNGSGKTSIINKIRATEVQPGQTLDFGFYINADELTKNLNQKKVDLTEFSIIFAQEEFDSLVIDSGLLNEKYTLDYLKEVLVFSKEHIKINPNHKVIKNTSAVEKIAQIIAFYLREVLLSLDVKFSFETVFSHKGKVEFIQRAKEAGYKVYLYFVSTESPNINIYRVKEVRVKEGGHDVPEELIVSRYKRSMDFLYEASQYCYQVYFFDNSKEGETQTSFAHFKINGAGKKDWNVNKELVPRWFYQYYSSKVK